MNEVAEGFDSFDHMMEVRSQAQDDGSEGAPRKTFAHAEVQAAYDHYYDQARDD